MKTEGKLDILLLFAGFVISLVALYFFRQDPTVSAQLVTVASGMGGAIAGIGRSAYASQNNEVKSENTTITTEAK